MYIKEKASNKEDEGSLGLGEYQSKRLRWSLTWKSFNRKKLAQRELGMGGFPLQMVPNKSLQDGEEDDEASFSIRANVGVDWI